jgi:hypothetical protein
MWNFFHRFSKGDYKLSSCYIPSYGVVLLLCAPALFIGNKKWIDFYLGLFFTSFDFKQSKDNHFLKEYFVDFSCT